MTAGSVAVPHVIPVRVPPPGKAKHEIDTATPVEIKSDSPEVRVFYTLDGSRPEARRRGPGPGPGPGGGGTLTYSGPIRLPPGRVNVKALAVSRDGRESAVVTKLFLVENLPSNDSANHTEDDEDNFLKEHQSELSLEFVGGGAWPEGGSGDASLTLQVPQLKGGGASCRSPIGPRFLSCPGPAPPQATPTQRPESASLETTPLRALNHTHLSRIQRQTDFLRCSLCLSPRPSDPFSCFCLQCGATVPPLPSHRLPPPEAAQCETMVPVNTSTCVVCEAPMSPQLQPQASLQLQEKVICPSCGTGNPAHILSCVTCETRLLHTPTAGLSGQRAKMVSCSRCCRANHPDARYCDWCGSKCGGSASLLVCGGCGSVCPSSASYCGCCGLACPPGGAVEHSQRREGATCQTLPPPSSGLVFPPAPPGVDQETQTAGLYPSARQLLGGRQQGALQLSRQEDRDRRPRLTAVSPGRGYWRQQLDHVCSHLRSFTQNSPEFRTLLGEPRLGRMVSAVLQEDNYEVSLRINFTSAAQEKSCQGDGTKRPLVLSESQQNLSSVTEGRNVQSAGQTTLGSENGSANRTPDAAHTPPPTKDSQLLKEVGPEGRGQISLVQRLLDEGADPSCRGVAGRPVLTIAVLNGHHDVIPVLVQRGAAINQTSGPRNNTALHEAAARGRDGLQCAETLLGCKANIRKRNGRGQTASDLAVTSLCSPLVSVLAARTGQGLLDKLG